MSRVQELEGLAALATSAESPVAREIALAAAARGWSLTRLGAAYSERGTIEAANVVRHLTARKMRAKTIERYRVIVGLDAEHLVLAGDGGLDPDRHAFWRTRLLRTMMLDGALFAPGTLDLVLAEWQTYPDKERRSVAAFALAELRAEAGVFGSADERAAEAARSPWPRFPGERAFVAAMRPSIDLAALRRAPLTSERALADVALALHALVPQSARDAIVSTARSLLIAHGHDVAAMDERLHTVLAQLAEADRQKESTVKP